MFSHHSFKYFKILLCIFGPINFGLITANGRFEESIVFPSTFLQRQRALFSLELLTNNAISSESVVELSRSSEAFSLEYFQVIIFFITYWPVMMFFIFKLFLVIFCSINIASVST